jgi:hypothetical protein
MTPDSIARAVADRDKREAIENGTHVAAAPDVAPYGERCESDVDEPTAPVVPDKPAPVELQHDVAVFVDAHMKRRGDWVSFCYIDTDRKTGKQGPFCSVDVLKTPDTLAAFVRAHPNANLYCGVNRSKVRANKRHDTKDIEWFDEIVADFDPYIDESPADLKARILEKVIPKLQFPPTTIRDSGNGIQLAWRIKPKELNGDLVLAEHFSLAALYIAQQFAGDNVSDMPRVMRADGSVNIPSDKKRKCDRSRSHSASRRRTRIRV